MKKTRIEGLYLHDNGTYYFRKQIPVRLRPTFSGDTHWQKSLGTRDFADAKTCFAAENARFEAALKVAKEQFGPAAEPITPERAAAIATTFLLGDNASPTSKKDAKMRAMFTLAQVTGRVADEHPFKNAHLALPAHLTKAERERPFGELVIHFSRNGRGERAGLAPASVKKFTGALSAIIKVPMKAFKLTHNPFAMLEVPNQKNGKAQPDTPLGPSAERCGIHGRGLRARCHTQRLGRSAHRSGLCLGPITWRLGASWSHSVGSMALLKLPFGSGSEMCMFSEHRP